MLCCFGEGLAGRVEFVELQAIQTPSDASLMPESLHLAWHGPDIVTSTPVSSASCALRAGFKSAACGSDPSILHIG